MGRGLRGNGNGWVGGGVKKKKALRKQLNPNKEQPFLKGRKQKR